MQTERTDHDGYSQITIRQDDDQNRAPWDAYRVTCMDIDLGKDGRRTAPTAHIALLAATDADITQTRRLAAEYAYVADVAEALQTEKRAAYDELARLF